MERYLLGPELGRGGMGRVHLAWDPMLRRTVALKVLLGDDPEMHLRLLREARAQARLEHPHICRIHDLGEQDGRPYIAMQLVRGRSLSELRPELDFMEVAAIMADVAGAVHAAHQSGMIHRDLKPANILVEERDSRCAFVVDFGLARDLQAMDQTLSWAVMGTPAFMSPEQARGEALGPGTDVYSLGATLYAMLTGHPPFEGSTLAGILTQQGRHGVRKVRRFNVKVPQDLETLTLKCLETEVPHRYPSALALEQELRRFLAGEPIQARPVGPLGRLARWARRKPTLAATATAGLLATLLLGGWNLHTRRQAAIREAAAQRFGMEIRDAEHLLRIERMMPIHDIRPAEARLRARMDSIRQEMERLGGASRGPGLYALGRGHLALRDYPKAIEDLQSAWNSGFQAPEVAYSIGLAYYRQFASENTENWTFSIKNGEKLARTRLEPALTWFTRGAGALVDSPTYGHAMVAMFTGNLAESEQLFDRALAEMPWFYEALLGQARNRILRVAQNARREGKDPEPARMQAVFLGVSELLSRAEVLAPSDEELQIMIGGMHHSEWIHNSAHGSRDPAPLKKATAALERARTIHPGSVALLIGAATTLLQVGFQKLSTGLDPGLETAAMAREIILRTRGKVAADSDDSRVLLGLRHNLWWVTAEADHRFGRDSGGALAEAARVRQEYGHPDLHFGFSLVLEALHRESRGLDPGPTFDAAEETVQKFLEAFPNHRNSFFSRTILGEIHLARAEALHRKNRDPIPVLGKAITELRLATEYDPKAAYPYYSLPRAHAQAARIALEKGQDGAALLRAALEAGRRGVAVNPRNAQIQQAMAEAHLVDGLCRVSRGEDPQVALAAARWALDSADAVNPRDYRAFLLRAEVELEAARNDPNDATALARCEAAARRGLSIKADEPEFRHLLARAAAIRGGSFSPGAAPAGSGRPAADDHR